MHIQDYLVSKFGAYSIPAIQRYSRRVYFLEMKPIREYLTPRIETRRAHSRDYFLNRRVPPDVTPKLSGLTCPLRAVQCGLQSDDEARVFRQDCCGNITVCS